MSRPHTAFILAAGYGKRMRPLTDTMPKPLVRLAGQPLLAHVIARLTEAGVARLVINVHYLADQIETYLQDAAAPGVEVMVSDERQQILDTGGGVSQALSRLGGDPFYIHNSDTVWIEYGFGNLPAMAAAWDDARMDALLLLAPTDEALGYDGAGDFFMAGDGLLTRRPPGGRAPFVFAGVSIAHPRLFEGAPDGAFSLNQLWDRAMANGRVHGFALRGTWMHVGTPEALEAAERRLRDAAA
jgi:MurNAc alpha-1-phosphate uridylyltransferase